MPTNYKIICLVCCRGGSKGIPGKNIKPFCGKPMLEWALTAAREAEVFDQIVLSTDSEEIAAVGERNGATIPGLRPAHLAADTSDQFDTHHYIFDLLNIEDSTHRVCILVNNPFINGSLIREGYEQALRHDFDRVVLDCVQVDGDFLYYRQCFEKGGRLYYHFPHLMLGTEINRQAQTPTYCAINNIRFGKPSVFRSYAAYKDVVVTNGIVPVALPRERAFDIDTPEDWAIAEAVFRNVLLKG